MTLTPDTVTDDLEHAGVSKMKQTKASSEPEPWPRVGLTEDEAKLLADTIRAEGEDSEVTLGIWRSPDGYGLHVFMTELPEEGCLLLHELPEPTRAQPRSSSGSFVSGRLANPNDEVMCVATVHTALWVDGSVTKAAEPVAWPDILAAVLREHPKRGREDGNAPGHGHAVPGIWDSDNGKLAGKPCAWCLTWNAALQALATRPSTAGEHPTGNLGT